MSTPWRHLERARSLLESATLLRDNDYLADAVSRAYYAMFTAARVALLARGIEARTQRGVRRVFSSGSDLLMHDRLSRTMRLRHVLTQPELRR